MPGIFDPENLVYGNKYHTDEDSPSDVEKLIDAVKRVELAKKASSTFYNLGDEETINRDLYNTSSLAGTIFPGLNPSDYSKYGVGITNAIDYNKIRAENQSGGKKIINGLVQAAGTVGDIALGTTGALGQLLISTYDEIAGNNVLFNNAMMEWGNEISEASRQAAPIYRANPDRRFEFGDWGWWAENLPSAASSIGAGIPAFGVTKALSGITKLMKSGSLGTKLKGLATVATAPGSAVPYLGKVGLSAFVMRNGENFIEAAETFNNAKSIAYNELSNLSDTEFSIWKSQNPEITAAIEKDKKELSVDNISNYIASRAAWNTYKMDASNVIFDALQIAPFFRGAKATTRTRLDNAKVANANRLASKASELSKTNKILHNLAYTAIKSSPLEIVTEGIEEMVNGIAQSEGTNYAKRMLYGEDSQPDFAGRLKTYLRNPALWEQAFWGAIGGAAFAGVGRLSSLIQKNSDTHSTKAKLNEITSRELGLSATIAGMNDIDNGINPKTRESIDTEEDLQEVKEDFMRANIAALSINAARRGNIGYFIEQLQSPDYAKFVATQNNISEADAISLLNDMTDIVKDTEHFYKHSASTVYNSSVDPNIKELLINDLVNIQTGSKSQRSKANKYGSKVAEYKASEEYKNIAAGYTSENPDSDISIDDIFEITSLLGLNKTINTAKSDLSTKKAEAEVERLNKLSKIVKDKINSYSDRFINAKFDPNVVAKLGSIFNSKELQNNEYAILHDEWSKLLDEDYYYYSKNLEEEEATKLSNIIETHADKEVEDNILNHTTKVDDIKNTGTIETATIYKDALKKEIDILKDASKVAKDNKNKSVESRVLKHISSLQALVDQLEVLIKAKEIDEGITTITDETIDKADPVDITIDKADPVDITEEKEVPNETVDIKEDESIKKPNVPTENPIQLTIEFLEESAATGESTHDHDGGVREHENAPVNANHNEYNPDSDIRNLDIPKQVEEQVLKIIESPADIEPLTSSELSNDNLYLDMYILSILYEGANEDTTRYEHLDTISMITVDNYIEKVIDNIMSLYVNSTTNLSAHDYIVNLLNTFTISLNLQEALVKYMFNVLGYQVTEEPDESKSTNSEEKPIIVDEETGEIITLKEPIKEDISTKIQEQTEDIIAIKLEEERAISNMLYEYLSALYPGIEAKFQSEEIPYAKQNKSLKFHSTNNDIQKLIDAGEITYTDENGKPCAEQGLTTSFTKGGSWDLVTEFKGASHDEGGIDINISKDKIQLSNKDGILEAKNGIIINNKSLK